LPAPFSWTGFYIGGNIGAAWAQSNVTDNFTGANFSQTSDAVFIGGGQLGFNYQFGGVVLGVEGDFDWAGTNNNNLGNGILIRGTGPFAAQLNNSRSISTVAARFGWAVDHWLYYGKVGGGWANSGDLTVTNLTTGASITGGSSSNSGFLAGGGVEYAIANNWTVKAEYDYLGLSSRTLVIPVGAPFLVGDVFTTGNRNIQEFKVGFNYKFW
jgi:outer membrane immunogenic protein